MKNIDFETCLKDSYETINIYFRYLHIGYFYSELSKRINFARISKNINVITGEDLSYILNGQLINEMLEDIYSKPGQQNIFSYLTIINSARGITMALVEALGDGEIKKLFLEHIFRNDEEAYDNFDGVVRFIRNTFSHNIRDRIELKRKDYEKQIEYLRKKGKSTINFFFDYAKSPIPINRENYTVKIDLDFNQIKDGVVYAHIISEYQTLLFIELCYNCMVYLKDKLG